MKMIFAWISGFLVAIQGCASSTEPKDRDLDIPGSTNSMDAKFSVDELDGVTPPVKIEAVINWQQFFKTAPSVSERKLIEQKLGSPAVANTSGELITRGRNEVALGQYLKAEASFREAIRIAPDNLECQLELAMLYVRKKELIRAFEFLAQIHDGLGTQESPDKQFIFRYRYTLAIAYITRGEREPGHRILSELIGQDKSFTPGYAALASSYLSIGKHRIAEFIAQRGIDRGQADPALYNVLGVVAEQNSQLEVAETWYNKALSIAPTFAPALVNRAGMNLKRGENDSAEDDLIRALMYQPHNVDALISLSIIHRKAGKFEESRASLAKALDIDSENAIARFNLAILLADDLGKPNEAIRLLYEVAQTAGSNEELRAKAENYANNIRENLEYY